MHDDFAYKKLIAWQTAMDMIPDVYGLAAKLPKEERFGLADQMRRAVISVPANIAEGHGRNGKNEFFHFLGISQGSLSELETLIDASVRLKYIDIRKAAALSEQMLRIRKLIFGLQASLKRT